jgi:hypothetical protein
MVYEPAFTAVVAVPVKAAVPESAPEARRPASLSLFTKPLNVAVNAVNTAPS